MFIGNFYCVMKKTYSKLSQKKETFIFVFAVEKKNVLCSNILFFISIMIFRVSLSMLMIFLI